MEHTFRLLSWNGTIAATNTAGRQMVPAPLTLECGGSLGMLALVWVHQQRQLPELPLDVLYRRVKP